MAVEEECGGLLQVLVDQSVAGMEGTDMAVLRLATALDLLHGGPPLLWSHCVFGDQEGVDGMALRAGVDTVLPFSRESLSEFRCSCSRAADAAGATRASPLAVLFRAVQESLRHFESDGDFLSNGVYFSRTDSMAFRKVQRPTLRAPQCLILVAADFPSLANEVMCHDGQLEVDGLPLANRLASLSRQLKRRRVDLAILDASPVELNSVARRIKSMWEDAGIGVCKALSLVRGCTVLPCSEACGALLAPIFSTTTNTPSADGRDQGNSLEARLWLRGPPPAAPPRKSTRTSTSRHNDLPSNPEVLLSSALPMARLTVPRPALEDLGGPPCLAKDLVVTALLPKHAALATPGRWLGLCSAEPSARRPRVDGREPPTRQSKKRRRSSETRASLDDLLMTCLQREFVAVAVPAMPAGGEALHVLISPLTTRLLSIKVAYPGPRSLGPASLEAPSSILTSDSPSQHAGQMTQIPTLRSMLLYIAAAAPRPGHISSTSTVNTTCDTGHTQPPAEEALSVLRQNLDQRLSCLHQSSGVRQAGDEEAIVAGVAGDGEVDGVFPGSHAHADSPSTTQLGAVNFQEGQDTQSADEGSTPSRVGDEHACVDPDLPPLGALPHQVLDWLDSWYTTAVDQGDPDPLTLANTWLPLALDQGVQGSDKWAPRFVYLARKMLRKRYKELQAELLKRRALDEIASPGRGQVRSARHTRAFALQVLATLHVHRLRGSKKDPLDQKSSNHLSTLVEGLGVLLAVPGPAPATGEGREFEQGQSSDQPDPLSSIKHFLDLAVWPIFHPMFPLTLKGLYEGLELVTPSGQPPPSPERQRIARGSARSLSAHPASNRGGKGGLSWVRRKLPGESSSSGPPSSAVAGTMVGDYARGHAQVGSGDMAAGRVEDPHQIYHQLSSTSMSLSAAGAGVGTTAGPAPDAAAAAFAAVGASAVSIAPSVPALERTESTSVRPSAGKSKQSIVGALRGSLRGRAPAHQVKLRPSVSGITGARRQTKSLEIRRSPRLKAKQQDALRQEWRQGAGSSRARGQRDGRSKTAIPFVLDQGMQNNRSRKSFAAQEKTQEWDTLVEETPQRPASRPISVQGPVPLLDLDQEMDSPGAAGRKNATQHQYGFSQESECLVPESPGM